MINFRKLRKLPYNERIKIIKLISNRKNIVEEVFYLLDEFPNKDHKEAQYLFQEYFTTEECTKFLRYSNIDIEALSKRLLQIASYVDMTPLINFFYQLQSWHSNDSNFRKSILLIENKIVKLLESFMYGNPYILASILDIKYINWNRILSAMLKNDSNAFYIGALEKTIPLIQNKEIKNQIIKELTVINILF